jgi:arginyl-tRNA synthetase
VPPLNSSGSALGKSVLDAEHSQKNPVYYVQYAHARISSILAKAGGEIEVDAESPQELSEEEKGLLKRLVEFPTLVREATERRAPRPFQPTRSASLTTFTASTTIAA